MTEANYQLQPYNRNHHKNPILSPSKIQNQANRNQRKLTFKKTLKTPQSRDFQTLVVVLLIACGYWAIATLNQSILGSYIPSPVWLPTGLSLLATLWLKDLGLIGVALGAWCFNLTLGYTLPSAILMTMGVVLQVMLGKWLLFSHNNLFSFQQIREILKPIALAAFVSTLISATFMLVAEAPDVRAEAWFIYWLRDSLGILAVVPLGLAILTKRLRVLALVQQRWIEAAVSFTTLIALSWIIFLAPADSVIHSLHPEYLALILVTWMSLRLGVLGAIASSLALISFSMIGLQTKQGPFFAFSQVPDFTILANQLFLMALMCSSLLLATTETQLRATKKHIKNLSRYIPLQLIDDLAGRKFLLEENKRHAVAVLQVEISGLASTVECLTPEAAYTFIHEIQTLLSVSVAKYHGIIQSRTSDGLIAVFGFTQDATCEPSAQALACARNMIESLAIYNAQKVLSGQLPIFAIIGVDYGMVVSDGAYSDYQQNFLIAGKVAKTVSYLKDLCIRFRADICISKTIKDALTRACPDTSLLEGFHNAGFERFPGLSEPTAVLSYQSDTMNFYYESLVKEPEFDIESNDDQLSQFF